ncbi:MAG TPA: hypothetical protein VGG39_34770 [Polyangiaceae bacterium]|jgi:hypothetical protein
MKTIPRACLPVAVLAASFAPFASFASFAAFASIASIAAWSGVAHADPANPTDNDKAAARPFAIEGLRLAQEGKCREAVEQLDKAEALVHAPTTAVPLAQCEIQLGKLVEGTELLNRVLNETLPPTAPPAFAEAKKQARGVLDAAAPRIPKLRIHVELPPGMAPALAVTVDGQPVPVVLLDNERPTDPGRHHVVAQQAGYGTAEADVTLAEGQVEPVVLHIAANGATGAAPVVGATADPYGQGVVAVPAAPPAAGSGVPGAPWNAFEFGVRLAFGLPFGSIISGNGNDLNHTVSNQFIPVWLDAGARIASHWYVGAYFTYGIASTASQFSASCPLTGVSCSANDTRLGVNAHYHVLPDNLVDPWFGLGFGYEWLSGSVSASSAGTSIKESLGVDGWEFANIQGGVDFHLLDGALSLGPTVTLTIDQYDHVSSPTNTNGATVGSSITNQALHEWLLLGVRGTYDLKL